MNDYWCFSVGNDEMFNLIQNDEDIATAFIKCVKVNHCIGVLQGLTIQIFVFNDRKEKNNVMMKAKDLGVKSVKHAYLTHEQIEAIEEYYSNIN